MSQRDRKTNDCSVLHWQIINCLTNCELEAVSRKIKPHDVDSLCDSAWYDCCLFTLHSISRLFYEKENGRGSKTSDVLSCETKMEQRAEREQGGSDDRGIFNTRSPLYLIKCVGISYLRKTNRHSTQLQSSTACCYMITLLLLWNPHWTFSLSIENMFSL